MDASAWKRNVLEPRLQQRIAHVAVLCMDQRLISHYENSVENDNRLRKKIGWFRVGTEIQLLLSFFELLLSEEHRLRALEKAETSLTACFLFLVHGCGHVQSMALHFGPVVIGKYFTLVGTIVGGKQNGQYLDAISSETIVTDWNGVQRPLRVAHPAYICRLLDVCPLLVRHRDLETLLSHINDRLPGTIASVGAGAMAGLGAASMIVSASAATDCAIVAAPACAAAQATVITVTTTTSTVVQSSVAPTVVAAKATAGVKASAAIKMGAAGKLGAAGKIGVAVGKVGMAAGKVGAVAIKVGPVLAFGTISGAAGGAAIFVGVSWWLREDRIYLVTVTNGNLSLRAQKFSPSLEVCDYVKKTYGVNLWHQ